MVVHRTSTASPLTAHHLQHVPYPLPAPMLQYGNGIELSGCRVGHTRNPSSAIVSERFTKMEATPNSDFLHSLDIQSPHIAGRLAGECGRR